LKRPAAGAAVAADAGVDARGTLLTLSREPANTLFLKRPGATRDDADNFDHFEVPECRPLTAVRRLKTPKPEARRASNTKSDFIVVYELRYMFEMFTLLHSGNKNGFVMLNSKGDEASPSCAEMYDSVISDLMV
jgi:hypothetical protein